MTRLVLAALAVVLSTVLVPLGITSTWLSLRVDSTEAYVDTDAPLANQRELRDRLAEEVAAAAMADLRSRVPASLLPASLDEVVRTATRAVVESPGFPKFWREANADAHREFLSIVHERDQQVDDDGWVVVDLRPLVDQALAEFFEQAGIPAVDLPDTPLPLPVMPESRLEETRGAYQVLEGLALWVPLLWAGLVGLAVLVAPGLRGRLRAGAACALGLAVGGGLVLLATPPATDAVVEQVDASNRDLARLVIEVVVGTLDDTARGAVVIGLLAAVALFGISLWPRRRAQPAHS